MLHRTTFSCLLIVATPLFAAHAQAAPVEYVRVCDAYGPDYFYSPGTDTCVNAQTGETRRATADGLESDSTDARKLASEGTALALSMPNATVDSGKTFGAAMNIGTFDGEFAVGVSGAMQVGNGLTFNSAVGLGSQGSVAGRAGLNFSW
jgi:hypothetical protein